jgi:hypothetical protein
MRGNERTPGEDAADAFVVLLTIGMVLTLLDESYWTRDYLVAGMVPALVLLVLAWWLRRLRDGVWIYSLLALAAYAPLGALAALQRPGPWIVPTLETINRVLGDTYLAPRLFVSTLPPVEASGTVMLLPYAIGFGVAAPAAWLALATRRPVAPMVPIVAGLGATIPVAVLVPDYYIARGVLLTVVLVTWAATRARRAEAVVGGRRTGLAGSLVAVTIVALVSGAVGLLVPDNDQTDRVRLSPAIDEGVAAAAADSLVAASSGRGELFRVTGVTTGTRLRFGALDLYNGEAWVPAEKSPGAGAEGTFRRLGREIAPLHDGSKVEVRVRIRPGYAGEWLPTLGGLTSLDLDYRDGRTQLKDVRYNQSTSSALVVGGVDARDDYTFTAVLPPDRFRDSDDAKVATEEQRQPEAAFLDQFLVPFDRTDLTPLRRVLLMARYLRLNGEVRLSGTSSQAPVDLGLRLMGAKRIVATPFQYSAVTALGASRLGVPARVVVGAEVGRRGIVEQRDVVSWVELQFADGTWRTLDPRRYTGVQAHSEDEVDELLGAGTWVERQFDLGEDEIKIPKGADIELSPDVVIEEQTEAWRVVGSAVAVLMAVVVVAWLAVPVAKAMRRRIRRTAGGWSGVYVNGWQEVLDAARDRGTPVVEWWSRSAQATDLGDGLALARVADAAVFAPKPSPPEDRRAYWDACMALRIAILRRTDLRHRLWALFNPASLLAGWARHRSR